MMTSDKDGGNAGTGQSMRSELSETDDAVTEIPPTQCEGVDDEGAGRSSNAVEEPVQDMADMEICELCGLIYEGPNENYNKDPRGRIKCNDCEVAFYRNPLSPCIQVMHGNEWDMPKHCNGCHDDGNLLAKFKQFDYDRNTCTECLEIAAEDREDASHYDHSVGEVDMVAQFGTRVQTIMIRSRRNTKMLDDNADTLNVLNKKVGKMANKLVIIQEDIKIIKDHLLRLARAPASGNAPNGLPNGLPNGQLGAQGQGPACTLTGIPARNSTTVLMVELDGNVEVDSMGVGAGDGSGNGSVNGGDDTGDSSGVNDVGVNATDSTEEPER